MPAKDYTCPLCALHFDYPSKIEYREDGSVVWECPQCHRCFDSNVGGLSMVAKIDPKEVA